MNEITGGVMCPQCDTPNVGIAAYCSGCGAALGRARPAPHATASPYGPYGQTAPDPALYAPEYQRSYLSPTPYAPPSGMSSAHYAQPYPPQPYAPQYAAPYNPQQAYAPPYGQPPYAQPPGMGPYGALPVPGYPGYAMPGINVNVSPIINVQMPAPPPASSLVVVNTANTAPSIVVRALWFIFFGLWLGLIATVVGWALCIGVVTLPVGLLILNRLPAIMTLRPPSRSTQVVYANGVTVVNTNVAALQHPLWLRGVYFLFVGSWFSLIWLVMAWCMVVLTPVTLGMSLAVAFMMFDRLPQVLTLRVN